MFDVLLFALLIVFLLIIFFPITLIAIFVIFQAGIFLAMSRDYIIEWWKQLKKAKKS